MHWVNYLFLYNGSNFSSDYSMKKKLRGKLVKNVMRNSPFLSQPEVKKSKLFVQINVKLTIIIFI